MPPTPMTIASNITASSPMLRGHREGVRHRSAITNAIAIMRLAVVEEAVPLERDRPSTFDLSPLPENAARFSDAEDQAQRTKDEGRRTKDEDIRASEAPLRSLSLL